MANESYSEEGINTSLSNLEGYIDSVDNNFRLVNKSVSSWSFNGQIPTAMNYLKAWNSELGKFNIKSGQYILVTENENSPVARPILRVYHDETKRFFNKTIYNVHIGGENNSITITNAVSSGGNTVYTADNTLAVKDRVTIRGISPVEYNVEDAIVTARTSTSFTIARTVSPSYTSGGVAEIVASFTSDLFIDYLDENFITQTKTFPASTDEFGYSDILVYLVYEKWEERNLGTDGWIISSSGNAIFNNLAVRGEINATSGNFDGFLTVNNGSMKIGANVNSNKSASIQSFQIISNKVVLTTTQNHNFLVGDSISVENTNSILLMSPAFPSVNLTVTGVSGSGTQITYTCANSLIAGSIVNITGVSPSSYNLSQVAVVSPTSTNFKVAGTTQTAYVSGGEVEVISIPYELKDIDGTHIITDVTTNTISYSFVAANSGPYIVLAGKVSSEELNDGIFINEDNHWYTDGHFKVGNSTNYVEWEGSELTVKGTLNDLELGRGGGNITSNFAVGIDALNSNTTGANNIALGQEALYSNTTGSFNIAAGYRSLYSNTASNSIAIGSNSLYSNTTGANNLAIGSSALQSNTTGISNIAIGTSSLQKNITGNNNLAIGYECLKENKADGNVAIGISALSWNTTGSENVAIGYEALYSNTGGALNLAIGNGALQSNTIGVQNIAIGNNALAANTTNFNLAIGGGALMSNTTGTLNLAIGLSALEKNTIASNNLAIGSYSLYNNTTGFSNLAIGSDTLYTNSTGSYNLAIGFEALKLNTDGSSNLAIGSVSLRLNTTGRSNLAIGSYSLHQNWTGSYNTAIGYNSLYANNGDYNLAIGQDALSSNYTGNRNIAIGFEALNDNVLGSSNLAIGVLSLTSNYSGVANIAIGRESLRTNISGSYNTAIGYGALDQAKGSFNLGIGYYALPGNSYASRNLAIGHESLRSNGAGEDNLAIGYQSMYLNDMGNFNLAIGYRSLYSNIGNLSNVNQGAQNTAIGYRALELNTTGNGNIAVGFQALYSNTSGQGLLAIGNQALYSNKVNGNLAIGNTALYNNTTGAGNFAVGSGALYSNTTGYNNLALGFAALQANTSGAVNVAIGGQSLLNNVTGSGNTAIGGGALSLATRYNNTAIGYTSGSSITTGYANVIIGPNSGSTIATLNNNVIISDGDGNIRLQADQNGAITIGGGLRAQGTVVKLDGVYNRTTTTAANMLIATSPLAEVYRSTASSKRWKNNVDFLGGDLDASKLLELPVRQFKFNNDYLNEDDKRFNTLLPGFVAEEVAEFYPIAAEFGEDDAVEDWNVRMILPPMLKLIQDQDSKIKQLEERLANLEN